MTMGTRAGSGIDFAEMLLERTNRCDALGVLPLQQRAGKCDLVCQDASMEEGLEQGVPFAGESPHPLAGGVLSEPTKSLTCTCVGALPFQDQDRMLKGACVTVRPDGTPSHQHVVILLGDDLQSSEPPRVLCELIDEALS